MLAFVVTTLATIIRILALTITVDSFIIGTMISILYYDYNKEPPLS